MALVGHILVRVIEHCFFMSASTDTSLAVTRCQECETEIPQGVDCCPACGRAVSAGISRIVLTVTILMIFCGFAFTQYVVNLRRTTESSLAVRWFVRGGQAMQANLPVAAAEDYRTALTFDRENRQYRLRLAQALLAANRLNEARAHLLSLWEQEPADGEANLTLARLFSRRGNRAEAVRYYSSAINGVWNEEPHSRRIAVRFELVRYLMAQNQLAQSRAELMGLQADGPLDLADQLLLGRLLLQVNEAKRATQAYDGVLATDPGNREALLGKGQALLASGEYKEAERSFAKVEDKNIKQANADQQLQLVREVLRLDPSLRGLSVAERAKRVSEAFALAQERLSSCGKQHALDFSAQPITNLSQADKATVPTVPTETDLSAPTSDLQMLYSSGVQKQKAATEPALRKDPDVLEPTMQYVFDVERSTAAVCPTIDLSNSALLILAQHESETVQ